MVADGVGDSGNRTLRWLIAGAGAAALAGGMLTVSWWFDDSEKPPEQAAVSELAAADLSEVREIADRVVREGDVSDVTRLKEARQALILRAKELSRDDLKVARHLPFEERMRLITDLRSSSARQDLLATIASLNVAIAAVDPDAPPPTFGDEAPEPWDGAPSEEPSSSDEPPPAEDEPALPVGGVELEPPATSAPGDSAVDSESEGLDAPAPGS